MLGLVTLIIAAQLMLHPPTAPPPPSASGPGAAESGGESSVAHLPEAVGSEVVAWRRRISEAKCLKVVCQSDETWANLYELDRSGSPKVVLREQFELQSWMMPGSVWTVVFAYQNGEPDRSRPIYQQYWSAGTGTVWERRWVAESASYRVNRYECDDEFGPTNPDFGAYGCIWATVTNSWLAGGHELTERSITVASVGFLRRPNLAMVPPDAAQPGMWLDVFWGTVPRDQDDAIDSLYRRQDFMLLARDDAGEPELREWRTLVVTDPSAGGMRPQQITGIRRFSYAFYDAEPAELGSVTATFVGDVDRAIASNQD